MNNNRLPLLVVFCVLVTTAFSQAESLLLYAPAPFRAKVLGTAKRQRYVKFNPTLMDKLAIPGSQFDLSLFDGEQVTLQVDKTAISAGNSNSFVIHCSVPGKPLNQMVLARENAAFTATYHTDDGRQYQIGTVNGELHYLSEVDPDAVAICGVKGKTPPTPVYNAPPNSIAPVLPGTAPATGPQKLSKLTANAVPTKLVLDVMVIYTTNAMIGAGGSADAINSQIKLAMAEGQDTFDNSLVNVQLRLVHTELTSYTETGDFNTDLARLGNPSDHFMDDALVTRDKYKADILSLWVEQTTGGLAGLAYQLLPGSTLYTYNVIYRPQAVGTYVPVHEIGHNFGCDHEPQFSVANPLYPYAHAYLFQSPNGVSHETVMSAVARPSRRVPPFFSNPNVTYDYGSGPVPIGTSSNNNALVINNTAAKLTSFRVPPSIGEALDATTINWTTGGNNQWFWQPGVTHDGSDAAQNGSISDGQTTWMQGTIKGPARLTFWWKCDTEPGSDLLIFSIDGVDQNQISGSVDWSQQVLFIPSGSHTIQWRYAKDAGGSVGQDTAWVDQVVVQPLKLPTVAITAPAANARVFAPNVTVTGTAKDDVQVDHVEYQLQNSSGNTGWQTASGKTNWSQGLLLVAGTNTITVRSIGFGSQTSVPVSRSFFYVVTNMLTVTTNGLGKITPDLNGKFLEIGRRYTITGTPSNNWVFSNWSGTISSNAAVLNFLMQPNMMLNGYFVTNPFIPVKGVYNGLFREADAVRQASAGFITLTLATSGSYGGKMNLDGASYVLSGRFDLYGSSQVTISRLHTNSVVVTMNMNLPARDDTINGTVSNGSWTSAFTLDRAVFDLVKNKATNYVGKYTLAIPGNAEPTAAPEGDSYATLTLDNAGMIRASGSLADGTAFSQTVSISKNGVWPLYAPLYVNKGMIFSEVTFSNSPASTFSGEATWIKPTMRTAYYSNGFTLNTALIGSSFMTPSNGVRVLNFTNGTIAFNGANLNQGFTNTVVVNSNNTTVVTGPNATTLVFDKTQGRLTGSHFAAPVTLRSTVFNGVILQNRNEARGYFLGTNQSGSVLLQGD